MSHTTKVGRNRRVAPMDRVNKALRKHELRDAARCDIEDGFIEAIIDNDQGGPINTGQLVFPTTFRLGTA